VSSPGVRWIRTPPQRASTEVADLLQTLFVAEALQPSRCLWIISPWVSDIPVVDNTGGSFAAIDPGWAYRPVRLSEALMLLLDRGGTIVLAARPDERNESLLRALEDQAESSGHRARLHTHRAEDLHEKGLLGDGWHIGGSMNFTYSGVHLLEEAVTYTTDPTIVAETRLSYLTRWGGVPAGADADEA
jgi:hypothetical protein